MSLIRLPPQPWQHIIMRLRQITSKDVPTGCAVVTLHVLTKGGQPVAWWEPNVKRLEPKSAASDFLAIVVPDEDPA